MTASEKTEQDWRQIAQEFLNEQLNERAPTNLEFAEAFDEKPLNGEGSVAVLFFELQPPAHANPCHELDLRHFVVVGETKPNYLPAYGLKADDAYSLHIGTRFFLEVGIDRLDPSEEPDNLREKRSEFVRGCNPGAAVSNEECVLLFRCNDQLFAVYKMTIEQTPVYLVGGDLPPGFITQPDFAPQVALRLHLGRLIRAEARRERDGLAK
ncbi:MAG: hypothetical protein AB7N71_03240 [Phycisphaerae bacterium]